MSVLNDLKQYIQEGLNVIPIVKGSKTPDASDWTTRNFTEADFTDEHGVAIRIDNGLVDVDLDCPEAVLAGGLLLPKTRTHGRAGNPDSHHWYKSPLDKPATFKDLDGTMLLEARTGSKQYTILPPSIHPSGEPYVWGPPREFLKIEEPDLRLPLNATAIATLFGKHWPQGNRHHAAAHLGGFLVRSGFDETWVVEIVRAAALIAKDEEVEDRVRAARDTVVKHNAGDKVTGAPKLKDVFDNGDKLVERVRTWLGHEGEGILDEFNEKYFVVTSGAKNYVFEEQGTRLIVRGFKDFIEKHCNRKVGKLKAGDWWLSHPARREKTDVRFAPPPIVCPPDAHNTWSGFSVVPDPDPQPERRCALFLQHLFEVVCSANKHHFGYLLDWCALTCQRPGEPIGVVVVMRGGAGAGKGTFASNFGGLFHRDHYVHISNQNALVGRFNASLSRKVVVFADEAVWGGNKHDAGNLKRLVTERTIEVEAKFRDVVTEPNCIHLLMATNESWAYPVMFRERRAFVLDVPINDTFGGGAYFSALYDEWENCGGAEAFLALCLARSVPGNRMGPVPLTAAAAEQQDQTMSGVEAWWGNVLRDGEIEAGKGWPDTIPKRTLQLASFATGANRYDSFAAHSRSLGMTMARLLPSSVKSRMIRAIINAADPGQQARYEEHRVHSYVLPSLTECRTAFDKATGIKREWDAIDEEQLDILQPEEGEL